MTTFNKLTTSSLTVPKYLATSAWLEHIPFAFWLIEKHKPRMIVELGVYYGVSYFSFCQAVQENNLLCTCYGVDNWSGDEHNGFYNDYVFNLVNKHNIENYGSFSYLINNDFDKAVKSFDDGSIDLLHIDGLHTYESVKNDFYKWLPKLSPRSIVLFHDTCVREREFGVYKLWAELQKQYPSFSFIHGYGLGVLATGSKIPESVSPLFKLSEADTHELRSFYYRLGNGIAEKEKAREIDEKIQHITKEVFTQKNGTGITINDVTDILGHVKQLQSQNESDRVKIEKLEDEIINYRQIEIALQSQIEVALQSQIDAYTTQLESVKRDYINETNNSLLAKNEIETLTNNLLLAKNEIETLTNNLLLAKNEIETLKQQAVADSNNALDYQNQINGLRIISEDTESKFLDKEQELLAAIQELERLKEELALKSLDYLTREGELKNEMLFLKDRIEQLHKEYIDKNEAARNVIEKLQRQNEEKDNEIISLTLLNDKNQQQFAANIEALNQKVSTVESDNAALIKKAEILEHCLKEEKKQKESIQQELSAITTSLFWKIIKPLMGGRKAMSRLSKNLFIARKGIKSLFNGKFGTNYKKWKKRKQYPNVPFALIEDYELLADSSLFDNEWYMAQYADVKENNADPVLHYLVHGYKEDRDPCMYFSTSQYNRFNSDIKDAGVNPLVHYLRHGRYEGRQYEASLQKKRSALNVPISLQQNTPVIQQVITQAEEKKPLKSPSTYKFKKDCREYKIIKESDLFDEEWYLSEYPEVKESNIDPIEHYLNAGWYENMHPSPFFHTSWYLKVYEDVRKSQENPFLHYIQQGFEEKREPHPLFRLHYFYQYNPDLVLDKIHPLKHFLKQGFKENRKIHPLFDEAFYQRQTGLDPRQVNLLRHYLSIGWKKNINPNPFFDVHYYQQESQNNHTSEPLTHFVQQGIEQKLNPSLFFDTAFYLQTNECAANLASDPLIHFLNEGIKLLRRPSASFKILCFEQNGGIDSIQCTDDLKAFVDNGNNLDPVYEYLETKERIDRNEKKRLQSYKAKKGDIFELDDSKVSSVLGQIKLKKNKQPKVSVIFPYFKARKFIIECLLSLSKWTKPDLFEVIIINDCSPDDIAILAQKIPNLIYAENEKNSGFVVSCNKAAQLAKGEYLLFLNSDAQVTKNAVENLALALDNDPEWGVVGPKVLYPSGHLQEAGCKIYHDGSTGFIGLNDDPDLPRYNYSREVDYVSGCSLMIRKKIFTDIGGFSPELAPGYCEDSDLCMKARAKGFKIGYIHDAVVYHYLSATNSNAYKNYYIARNQGIFFKKWFSEIQRLNEVKIIPFYFPQFHLYAENEFWWGKGFTEWTNVTKALPNYQGHIQPRLPSDQGFYDITMAEAMEHQKQLAEKYGVAGFCFYYYWFAGKRIMELPLERILKEDKPDFPFCICWANENFTRRWDGGNNEIMLGQNHTPEDDEAVIKDMLRYATHKNYIKINGKPLVFIYRFSLFPDIKRTVKTWRRVAKEIGIGEIFIGFVESFQHAYLMDDPKEFGFDISVQFPPHQNSALIPAPGEILNPEFAGNIHDYREMVLNYTGKAVPGFKRFPGIMPGWDNTPRQKNKPNIFAYSNPGSFQAWLEWNIKISSEQNPPGERFVFINAWNEWAEGTFLEPSREDGHGYLEAVRSSKQSWLR